MLMPNPGHTLQLVENVGPVIHGRTGDLRGLPTTGHLIGL
jgi:hypothetical protein